MNYEKRSSDLKDRVISTVAGLALLLQTTGCVDNINGVSLRNNEIQYFKTKAEEQVSPVYSPRNGSQPEKKDKKWYEDPWVVGGIFGGIALGGLASWGGYELYQHFNDQGNKKGRDDFGGDEGNPGPGGAVMYGGN